MYGRKCLGGDPGTWFTAPSNSTGGGTTPSTLGDGLLYYWLLDEASGNRAESEASETLADNNTVGSTTVSPIGVMTVQDSSVPEFLSNTAITVPAEFSIAFWTKTNFTGGSEHIIFLDAGGGTNIYFAPENNQWRAVSIGTGGISAAEGPAAATDTLTFFVGGRNGTTNKAWVSINGAAVVVAADSDGGLNGETAKMYVGCQPGNTFPEIFNLGRIGLWNRLLTADEITELYASGSGKFPPF